MSERSRQLLHSILERLHRTIKRRSLADLLYGTVLFLGIIAALFLFAVALEAGLWMQVPIRTWLFWLLLVLTAGLAGYFLVIPLLKYFGMLRSTDRETIAREIGQEYPTISDRLLNLLQLADGRTSSTTEELVDHAVQSLSETVQPVPFEHIEQFQRAKKVSRLASLPIIGLVAFLLMAPNSFLDATSRLLQPGTRFTQPSPFQLIVAPGSVDLVKGDSLEISIRAEGSALPRQVTLSTQLTDEDKISTVNLAPDSTGLFRHTIPNVRASFAYQVQADPVTSEWYEATIVERPIIRSLQVTLVYPRYSRIPAQRLAPNVGDVQALAGTRVQLEVGLSGSNVAEAFTTFDSGRQDTLVIEENTASGGFVLLRDGSYSIQLLTELGISNDDPIQHGLKVIPDAAPTILLTTPDQVSDLAEDLTSWLTMRISDDFGFSRLRLHYRLAETRFGQTMPDFEFFDLPLDNPSALTQEIPYQWIVTEQTSLDPVPGDVIEFFVQVWDNNSATGYKAARTPNFKLRLPSLAEQYEQLEEKEDETENELEELLRESRDMNEQFQELRDELRRKQEGDWEDERQLEQLQERQADMENRVEELTESFEEMVNEMSENNLANEETLEMYQELQKVMEEIQSPELMEALRELQEAMKELDLQQMQDQLNQFEQQDEQYMDRLERTLELFKQLRVQQDLDEAAQRAEELNKQQEQIEEETERLAEEAQEGENQEGEQQESEQQEGEQQEGENQEGEQQEGEQQEGEQQEGEQQEGEQQEGENQEGEQQEGEQQENTPSDRDQALEELAQKQELSKEEMEQLEQKLEEIMERMEEVRNAPQEQMEQLQDQAEQQNLPEQMQENADQLRQQQMDQAQQQQQNMQQQLQSMQQQLQNMQQNMQGSQMQINLAGLRRALSDILLLSGEQEALRMNVSGLAADSPLLRDYAQQQVELSEGLSTVSDSLQNLSRKIPQMSRTVQQHAGDALREMSASVESMTERISRQATGHQKSSMMHMNELALLLSDLLNQLSNQSSGSGGGMSMQQMIQQLQNAAQQQQQINQQLQEMLNQSQGQRLSRDMQERLRQMAAQQEALRSQMKQMSRNRDLRGKIMGDLNRIAKQMEESVREMQLGRGNRKTLERQRQILTRMLDATKSMQERGKERRREGSVAEDPLDRRNPAQLSPSEQTDQLRRALIEALESGYAPDYEELIKRYFELLQQQPEGANP